MTTKTLTIPSKFGNIPAMLYVPSKPIDLCVVFLHGRGENVDNVTDSPKAFSSTNQDALLMNAEKYGWTILAPQLVLNLSGWQATWLEEYTGACIDYALKSVTKLPKVGITGLSQGGGGVWRTATGPWASKIMFAVAICPTPEYNGDFSQIAKNHIPFWNFHAVDDKPPTDIVGSRNMIRAAQAHDPDPAIKYDEFSSGGHYIWSRVYGMDAVYSWAMLQYAAYKPTQQPSPDPFKPTHIIKRADGTSEQVRIETL